MTTKEYKLKDGVIKLTRINVTESYTNGFAEKVLKLENGVTIRISYNEDSIEIEENIK